MLRHPHHKHVRAKVNEKNKKVRSRYLMRQPVQITPVTWKSKLLDTRHHYHKPARPDNEGYETKLWNTTLRFCGGLLYHLDGVCLLCAPHLSGVRYIHFIVVEVM